MQRKSLKILAATVLCLGAMAVPAFAQVDISINLGVAPPPARVEMVPAPRAGYVWVPGVWFWDGHHHRWARGHWEHERPGYRWAPARWENRGNWHHYEPGRWAPEHEGPHGDNHPGRGHGWGHDRDEGPHGEGPHGHGWDRD